MKAASSVELTAIRLAFIGHGREALYSPRQVDIIARAVLTRVHRMSLFGRWSVGLFLVCCALTVSAAPNDPFEPLNRKVMAFNDVADRYVLSPVARAYLFVLPTPLERGVHNVFVNLDGPLVAINQLLQGKPGLAAQDTGRFLLNTTVGLVGIFDVASKVGLARHEEDFGQTFALWGVPTGPYIVVPLLGPSTPLFITGDVFAIGTQPLTYLQNPYWRYGLRGVSVIDTRAQLLETEKLISGDRYNFIRDAYLQHREFLIKDGNVRDTFLDEEN